MKNQISIEDFLRAKEIAQKQKTLKDEMPDVDKIAEYINSENYTPFERNRKLLLPKISRNYKLDEF